MSTVEAEANRSSLSEAIRRDLSSLACRAAIEIDNLILERSSDLQALPLLAKTLRDDLIDIPEPTSPSSLLNPTTAIVVNGAISEASRKAPLRLLDEVVGEAKSITAQFDSVLQDPQGFRSQSLDDLENMRSFCLALSRRAFGFQRPRHSRTPRDASGS